MRRHLGGAQGNFIPMKLGGDGAFQCKWSGGRCPMAPGDKKYCLPHRERKREIRRKSRRAKARLAAFFNDPSQLPKEPPGGKR